MDTRLVGVGWNFPVRIDPDGGFAATGGSAKLEQSMRLILLTHPGERVRRVDFGSRLRDFLFEPVSPAMLADLAGEVRDALYRWEPRVQITDVRAVPEPDVPGLVHIDIAYTVLATGAQRDMRFEFQTRPDGGSD